MPEKQELYAVDIYNNSPLKDWRLTIGTNNRVLSKLKFAKNQPIKYKIGKIYKLNEITEQRLEEDSEVENDIFSEIIKMLRNWKIPEGAIDGLHESITNIIDKYRTV